MEIDPELAEQESETLAAAPEPNLPREFTPAPLLDILFEQLDYLTVHVSDHCPEGCSDCVRLSQVTNWLLLPFR